MDVHDLSIIAGQSIERMAQAVSRLQHVDTRHQVWKELAVLGDTVFPTVAPFIRVRRPECIPVHVPGHAHVATGDCLRGLTASAHMMHSSLVT